jgi:hypothetical protein
MAKRRQRGLSPIKRLERNLAEAKLAYETLASTYALFMANRPGKRSPAGAVRKPRTARKPKTAKGASSEK